MSFLDDLRNGIFVVAGRPNNNLAQVMLRPRTHFNPLGTLHIDADRLILTERVKVNVNVTGDNVEERISTR